MEIYVAISDFTPPIADGSQNILEFQKGDTFEIFDCHKTDADWWGARSLKTNTVGYVPSRYMQYEERRIGKLLPSGYKDQKQTSLKRLSDIQNSPDHRAPEDMYNDNMEPEPDYNDEADVVAMDTINANKERTPSQSSDDGIIVPKKLPNPCVESPTRQALHKELLLNYKRGVNVLEKPELNKVLQNRRETQRRKEWQEQASSKRTSLEMKLEQRATRLKEDEMKTITEKDESEKPELQKAFAKFAQKSNGNVK
ncbi:uncharacterized protein LOC132741265 isoform X3 [Ruditapes philippinarum]|uniref:uncharacterized protein LOC132741265 isoform X3 n=1 Tax=Ruditapes philippinarum TaxID=129788 RepID=UPI00295BD742|nr:uncharacterized protein LOC132741265 isoform X3 [Ruditapes philippinarum]